ncbi:ABC transporter substrate-binding protein [Mycolicibacterium fluoranthenivorans]|uniref:ABC transporter substrate-binding protein n=1 Tax=Mycolicibacterium fluoranthenivorans TaxID=258505 RepID=A0A7G8PHM5_9MYCO|nr:ABC transporter substrate-binding protein [Mycolicibacterium fluoranthenivorans]QNJ93841.1 ABC transporter substrate-binding protein [Mycolicibacterium fluoranthenivorans]
MSTHLSRRGFLAMTAGVALVAACSPEAKPGTVAKDGSVTVKHAFGETKIPAPPTRVVSAGLNEQDFLLAVGVVPIAVTDWFGGQPFGVWPWATAKLGSAQPALLNLANGIDTDAIAALKPDLIVATNAGLDKDTYDKLAGIAPTVAQSGQEAFFEPWKDQATTIGQAVFKHDEMQRLVTEVDDKFTTAGKSSGQFAGHTALLLEGALSADHLLVCTGWRSEFLTELGFSVPTVDSPVPRDKFKTELGSADVLIWTTDGDAARDALLAEPDIAARTKHNVFTDPELAAAIMFSSPLSLPLVADRLPPLLATAVG